ncbi:unnamed protein product [Miscanthus lutarioriparius]|uniref:Uncharacterized protein n=1 Tax=Miscanthus lutarioriparius TaxID=422564 RepID=A0A811N2S7_9POAL|nr:unnamed protein product [Miscanthus lutarioriparius]
MEQGDKKIVGLEVGWSFVATGLSKIRRAIDGGGEGLSSEESSRCEIRIDNKGRRA